MKAFLSRSTSSWRTDEHLNEVAVNYQQLSSLQYNSVSLVEVGKDIVKVN